MRISDWSSDVCSSDLRSKLSTDPLYPGALRALRGSTAPVMDLGCGLGLLAHALRQDGQAMPYYGVDNDADKIGRATAAAGRTGLAPARFERSEEHTSELQSLMRISYAVFCLKKKKHKNNIH